MKKITLFVWDHEFINAKHVYFEGLISSAVSGNYES